MESSSIFPPPYASHEPAIFYLSTDFAHTVFHFSFNSAIIRFSSGSSVFGAFSFNALPVRIVESYVACLPLSARWNSRCLASRCFIFSGALPILDASNANSSRPFSVSVSQFIKLDLKRILELISRRDVKYKRQSEVIAFLPSIVEFSRFFVTVVQSSRSFRALRHHSLPTMLNAGLQKNRIALQNLHKTKCPSRCFTPSHIYLISRFLIKITSCFCEKYFK